MIKLFNQYFPVRKILFFSGECIFIAFAVVISLLLHGEMTRYTIHPLLLISKILLTLAVYQISLFFSDFYSFGISWNYKKLSFRLIVSLIIAFFILATVYTISSETLFTTKVLFTILIISLCFLLPWRLFYSWFINLDSYKQRVLIIGSGKLARDIARAILKEIELSLHVEGFIASDPKLRGISLVNPKVIGTTEEISTIVNTSNIHKIIVAIEERRGSIPLDDLLKCKSYGISIEDGVSFYEKITNQLLVEYINPSDLIFCDGFKLSYISMFFKRTYDIILSLFGLIITSPIFLITALLIKFESRGPVFFKQERVGRNEKTFYIYKFRSMLKDAEKITGPIMSFKNDQRITRFGRFIRKTRVDELPQLWNIFKGDMSFVGPRPERPVFVRNLKNKSHFTPKDFPCVPVLPDGHKSDAPTHQTLSKL